MKRLRAIILLVLLTASWACQAERLKCVDIDSYDHVNYDVCYLQFPARHHRFEALYRKIEHIRRGGTGVVNILHVGGSHVQAGVMSHRLRCDFGQMMPGRPQSRGLMFPFRAERISSSVGFGFRSSSALPAITMPGVQNPHWTDPLVPKA